MKTNEYELSITIQSWLEVADDVISSHDVTNRGINFEVASSSHFFKEKF